MKKQANKQQNSKILNHFHQNTAKQLPIKPKRTKERRKES